MDFNKYVGLPYSLRGRDESGIDCWGLVRLVYKEQFDIELPSLVELYPDGSEDTVYQKLAEDIAIRKEKWEEVASPDVGDIVLLRHNGFPVHVGIFIGDGKFLHAFGGTHSVVDRLTSVHWRNRIVGYFKYKENALEGEYLPKETVTVSGAPHPLRNVYVEGDYPAGASLEDIIRTYATASGWPEDLEINGVVWVDSKKYEKSQWSSTFPAQGSKVEIRVVAGKSGGGIFKIIAAIAISFVAPYLAVGTLGTTVAGTVGALTTTGVLVSAGITILGNMLLGAIFPVRPPSQGGDQRSGRSYYALTAGGNQQNQYGAIPVVLGAHRFAGPLAAVPWVQVQNNEKYLRMAVLWGYGPMAVSNFRIGSTDINLYEDVDIETLTGVPGEDKDDFNSIYGKDITQVSIGINPEGAGDWIERTIDEDVNRIEVNLTAQAGLYNISKKSGDYGTSKVSFVVRYKKVGSSTWYDFGPNVLGRSFNLPTSPAPKLDVIFDQTLLGKSFTWFNLYVEKGVVKIKSGGSHRSKTPYNSTMLSIEGYVDTVVNPVPSWPAGVTKLYQICILNDPGTSLLGDEVVKVNEIIDLRSGTTGFGLTATGTKATVADGHVIDTTDEITLQGASPDPIDFVLARTVPVGQYTVAVRRVTPDTTAANVNDRVTLTSITGIANRKPINPRVPMAMSALKIKSSNQLNGNLEGLSALCQSICLDYVNPTIGWRLQTTSNPASLYRYVLQHPANPRPKTDAEIDIAALEDWHQYCKTNGFEYNAVVVMQRSVDDLLRDIAAAGRASPSRPNGLYSVVIDRPISSISQHFTPHNSWGFTGAKRFPRIPHALRIGFANEERDYQPDEITVYNDGYNKSNATEIESIELPGVTSPEVAYKHGRFHIAQAKLRPEEYSLYCDIEHLICTRGDRVKVTHDVPMWGLGSGRIKELTLSGSNVTGIILDEEVPMQAGTNYTLRYRRSANGSSYTVNVSPVVTSGYYDELSFASSISTNKPAVGDLVMFGSLDSESVDCVILGIEPADNETARITLVDYAPALAVVDTEEIPEWESNITRPPGISANQIRQNPSNISMISDETAMERLSNGGYQNSIIIKWRNPSVLQEEVDFVEVQYGVLAATNNTWTRVTTMPGTRTATLGPVVVGAKYDIRIRYISKEGRTGAWVYATHIVTGKLFPPEDITGFAVNIVSDVATLTWNASKSVNISHYRIRYSPVTSGATWQSSSDIVPEVSRASTSVVVPAMVGSYLIKAVDDDGRESLSPAIITSTVPGLTNLNVIESIDESLTWIGVKDTTWASGTGLRLDSVDMMAEWTSLSSVLTLSTGINGIAEQGHYYFDEEVGLGAVYTCRVTAEVMVTADNVLNTISGWESLSNVVALSGDVQGLFDAWLEISTANNDDPEGSPTWGPWQRFILGDHRARAFRFRLVLQSLDSKITPVISSAKVFIDMPDRIVSLNDISCPAAGLSVVYPSAFRVRPAVAISAENMQTGDYYTITSATESGFFIRFFNSAGTGVARKFDYLSKGYGAIIV